MANNEKRAAPVCECVECVVDRETTYDEYVLFAVDAITGKRRYFNPNTGAPTFFTDKRGAPRVGPRHVRRASGLQAEKVHDTAAWYELGMRAVGK